MLETSDLSVVRNPTWWSAIKITHRKPLASGLETPSSGHGFCALTRSKYKMTPEGYTRVYVGGLNESIKKEDLQMEFEKYGKLNKVWVAFNPPGFAFIEFLNMNEAELACTSMNGTEIMGAKLRVEISRGRGRGGGRGGTGGFRGGRGAADYGGGYYAGRGGGSRGRGRYGEDYMSNRAGGYVTRDGYTQDTYAGNNVDTSAEYYTGKDTGTSRYRSRSPAGRGSHRHLRECT
ncbi:hypothetical protein KM043_002541 [Ampulex compressa]|nr:hypothetical protein KM043_002541 [Ampulex compressa]